MVTETQITLIFFCKITSLLFNPSYLTSYKKIEFFYNYTGYRINIDMIFIFITDFLENNVEF